MPLVIIDAQLEPGLANMAPPLPTDMNRSIHREACSWAEIKGRLDPAWSYVVIETSAATPSADIFSTVTALLAEHAAGIKTQEIFRETSSGKLLMLIQIAPELTDVVKLKLLDPRLPPSVTVFFYDRCSPGEESWRHSADAG